MLDDRSYNRARAVAAVLTLGISSVAMPRRPSIEEDRRREWAEERRLRARVAESRNPFARFWYRRAITRSRRRQRALARAQWFGGRR